jgi:hypothetical protein
LVDEDSTKTSNFALFLGKWAGKPHFSARYSRNRLACFLLVIGFRNPERTRMRISSKKERTMKAKWIIGLALGALLLSSTVAAEDEGEKTQAKKAEKSQAAKGDQEAQGDAVMTQKRDRKRLKDGTQSQEQKQSGKASQNQEQKKSGKASQNQEQKKSGQASRNQNKGEKGAMKRGQHRNRGRAASGKGSGKGPGAGSKSGAGRGVGQGFVDADGDGVCDNYQQRTGQGSGKAQGSGSSSGTGAQKKGK